jgi:hypothetical protein
MWRLLHFLESIDKTGEAFIQAIPMMSHSQEWTKTLLSRIANHPESRVQFLQHFKLAPTSTQQYIEQLLEQMMQEDMESES